MSLIACYRERPPRLPPFIEGVFYLLRIPVEPDPPQFALKIKPESPVKQRLFDDLVEGYEAVARTSSGKEFPLRVILDDARLARQAAAKSAGSSGHMMPVTKAEDSVFHVALPHAVPVTVDWLDVTVRGPKGEAKWRITKLPKLNRQFDAPEKPTTTVTVNGKSFQAGAWFLPDGVERYAWVANGQLVESWSTTIDVAMVEKITKRIPGATRTTFRLDTPDVSGAVWGDVVYSGLPSPLPDGSLPRTEDTPPASLPPVHLAPPLKIKGLTLEWGNDKTNLSQGEGFSVGVRQGKRSATARRDAGSAFGGEQQWALIEAEYTEYEVIKKPFIFKNVVLRRTPSGLTLPKPQSVTDAEGYTVTLQNPTRVTNWQTTPGSSFIFELKIQYPKNLPHSPDQAKSGMTVQVWRRSGNDLWGELNAPNGIGKSGNNPEYLDEILPIFPGNPSQDLAFVITQWRVKNTYPLKFTVPISSGYPTGLPDVFRK
ncbi:MAG: hypothetical protein OHK0029_19950 [Armatimonadaceae bacterium]